MWLKRLTKNNSIILSNIKESKLVYDVETYLASQSYLKSCIPSTINLTLNMHSKYYNCWFQTIKSILSIEPTLSISIYKGLHQSNLVPWVCSQNK